ncbi:MAG: glycosyltransferase family 2 protein [Saprospiraceae bacterium]|nr:glycosyltransferase family 2 protein [Saprospiraceae bacterium]
MKFSIVYPTRNRPELLKEGIRSILLQEFQDWELIISDNDPGKSAENIFNQYKKDERIKYHWTGGQLAMADNFTFGLSKATGDYVTVLTDKTTLIPSCLNICNDLLNKEEYDLINWSEAHFYPRSKNNISSSPGFLRIVYQTNEFKIFDPKEEIKYLLEFRKHRSHDMPHYFRGKILFGVVRRKLIADLVEKKEFFLKYAPDYTTRMIVLSRARKAIEITAPLQCAFISGDSNGMLCSIYPDKAFAFFNDADQHSNVNTYFPIKGLYTSQQNHVAGDYLFSLFKLDIPANINMTNLYRTMLFDLLKVKWNNPETKNKQMNLFYKAIQAQNIKFRLYFFLVSYPIAIFLYWRYLLNKLRIKIYSETNSGLVKSILKHKEVNTEYENITEANLNLANEFKMFSSSSKTK